MGIGEVGDELRRAEAMYRDLVERLPAIVYTASFGEDGAWHYVSPQVEPLLGYTPAEWEADPGLWFSRVHPDDRERVSREEADTRATGHPFASEYRMLTRTGHIRWIRDEASVVRVAGQPAFLQGLMYDVTSQREADEVLRQAYDRERQAAARLRSLDEMKNTFLSAVSHELRTPLTAAYGMALTLERARGELDEDEQRAMLSRVAVNLQKLDGLLTDLLDVDRLQRGEIAPERRTTDLRSLVRTALAEVDLEGLDLHVDVAPVAIDVDPTMVERILANLLHNAVRHVPSGTRVWVLAVPSPDGVTILVEDEGPGVPDDLKREVFKPFRQGPKLRPQTPGTGIGLSLVARFAELHGGRAWVEDRDGGGAQFCVFLPRLPLAAPRAVAAR